MTHGVACHRANFPGLLMALASALSTPGPDPAAPLVIQRADLARTDSPTPPPDDAPWIPVPLPDHWSRPVDGASRQGDLTSWYRVRFPLEEPPRESWSVYLWRLNMNAEVYLNGEPLGDGGRMDEPVARNWNRPLLFRVPPSLWRVGDNTLHVRLRSYPRYGALTPIEVGPTALLEPKFKTRRFVQNTASTGLFFITMAVALFTLGLWVRLPRERMYLLFGASALAWSTFSLNLFVRDIPVSAKTWWWLVHSCIDWWIALLALFVHRFVGLRRPRVDRAVVAFAAGGTLLYALTPISYFNRVNALWHMGAIVITVYLAVILVQGWIRIRSREVGVFAVLMAVLLLLGVHDWLLNTGRVPEMWRQGFHMLHFAAPLSFMVMTWHLTGRFIRALEESRRLNEHLEGAIASARAELERGYIEKVAMERAHTAAQERERLYRDLHDDMGAKLLSLVYRAETEENADLARSILQDLRDVVSRPTLDAEELLAVLADIQAEARERLAAAEIDLVWHQNGALPNTRLGSENVLNLVRLVREAISNVIHHAEARRVEVRLATTDRGIEITITDDGPSTDAGRFAQGRGTRTMIHRAQKLGGRVRWQVAGEHGCAVVIELPIEPERPPQIRG